eukprot:TRINITY_DN31123_c0_g1_i1.p1 TRINITY_DN31123_c0_g1~~TRINITY_DN31123_c0_g1_i1.p1  ORF type:complete len:510 (-),score=65.20 TRINITY_DN31123_c0_g1_i1:215-1522(-)
MAASAFLQSPLGVEALWPPTEAEASSFNGATLSDGLTEADVEKIQELLRHRDLAVLGSWRENTTALREMNDKLRKNTFWSVDEFFDGAVARELFQDMKRMSDEDQVFSLLTSEEPPRVAGSRKNDFAINKPAAAECQRLDTIPFDYRHHDWTKDLTKNDYKQVSAILRALQSSNWAKAINILLRGTGFSVLHENATDRLKTATVMFREFEPGDYSLLHTDNIVHGENFRVLSLNAWFSTPGWRSEFGGNFLWCGGKKNFVGAERLTPEFNQLAVFLPLANVAGEKGSNHLVEIVHDNHGREFRRFSLTSFMTLKGDAWKHWRWRGLSATSNEPELSLANVSVTFLNTGGELVKLLWVRPEDGERLAIGEMAAGRQSTQNTYVGHVFEVVAPSKPSVRQVVKIFQAGTVECGMEADTRELACRASWLQPQTKRSEL